MLFRSIISAALFAAAAVAEIKFTSWPTNAAVGGTYQLTWTSSDSTTPVTILLRKGPANNLQTVATITASGVGGSYSWTPEKSLPNGGDYAFEIVQGNENNYSGQFPLTGGSAATLSLSSASASASASASGSITSASASASSASASSASASSASASRSSSASASSSATIISRTTTSSSATGTATGVPASGGASGLQSPVAFILCAIAAMLYLN